jgi:hypothetical protein
MRTREYVSSCPIDNDQVEERGVYEFVPTVYRQGGGYGWKGLQFISLLCFPCMTEPLLSCYYMAGLVRHCFIHLSSPWGRKEF